MTTRRPKANGHEPAYDPADRLNRWLRFFLRDKRVTHADFKVGVCVVILHFNDHDGRCDPSVRTIAEETALTERTVYKSLARLRDLLEYLLYESSGGGSKANTNNYSYCLPPLSHQTGVNQPPLSRQTVTPVPADRATPVRPGQPPLSGATAKQLREQQREQPSEQHAFADANGVRAKAVSMSEEGKQAKQDKRTSEKKDYEPLTIVQNRIAGRLGKGDIALGWEFLIAMSDDERQRITDCERRGSLDDVLLDRVRSLVALNGAHLTDTGAA